MALNSMIRKIPLLGNCDLTNFHSDIHDYEGFETDNSLFLNKRKVNWWKRNVSGGEIGGGLRGVVNGDYFDVYKDNDFIGKVSRQYYKLDSGLSADAWRSETLQKVQNPFPADSNTGLYIKGKYVGKSDSVIVEQCGNYYFVGEKVSGGIKVTVYDSNVNVYDEFTINAAEYHAYRSLDYVGFFYRENGFNFSYTFNEFTEYHPTFNFSIPAGCVYINLGTSSGQQKEGYVYKISTKELFVNSNSFRFLTVRDGDTNFVNFDPDAYQENSGATGKRRASIDYGYQYVYYDINVINNKIYILIYNWFGGYSVDELKVFLDGGLLETLSPGQDKNPLFICKKETTGITEVNKGRRKYKLSLYTNWPDLTTDYFTKEFFVPNKKFVHTVYNYSKKFGPWTVNFTNNKAYNIAHNYKKLYEIEGDEDSDHYVNAIDGYNDTYIYFHYGSDYFRISIQTADKFADVVKSLNNVYYIFNTVSYLNAYYSGGNDWFCSCDDWNDRAQWYTDNDDIKNVQLTSRLNNNWQTKTDVVSVSDQIAPNLTIVAVRPDTTTMHAYGSSATWDGFDTVYDSSGNVVDTSSWEYGHSLAGYYYALIYITLPNSITPFYVDDNYTCPVYLDQNLIERKQEYTVFFPTNAPFDSGDVDLSKQGDLSVDGFDVDPDTGYIFAVPEDNSQYQRVPALLDTKYLVYLNSIVIIKNDGNYVGMWDARIANYVLIFLNESESEPIKKGDSVFVINGIQYTYFAESSRIVDYNGNFVCNADLLQYVGFSTKCAYFYCEFDRAIYVFEGDNSVRKLVPMERYKPSLSVYEDVEAIDTLNIPSIDIVIVNLDTVVLILYGEQYVILETGTVNSWSIDEQRGTFIINGIMYSLNKSALAFGNVEANEITPIPIAFETQFYGDSEAETNMINDCLYLTIDNLQNIANGTIKIQAVGLCNGKIVRAESKEMNLKNEDFNELSQLLIKFQPKIQEAKGLKFYIESDFEIAEMKVGTSAGAMNQTTKRI